MATHIDPNDENAIVFDGFENGIAENPYDGISDMRNVNIISIPEEGSVNFSTIINSPIATSGSITSVSTDYNTITITGNPSNGSAVIFTGADLPAPLVAGTIYWITGSGPGGAIQVFSTMAISYPGIINITTTGSGTRTYVTVNMALPKYSTICPNGNQPIFWVIDSSGRVWATLPSGGGKFIYTGNLPNQYSNGNGIVFYQDSNGTPYIFAFSDSSIDYATISGSTITWHYRWNWLLGGSTTWSDTPDQFLITAQTINNPHETIIAPDNKVYFTDANYIGRFYQASLSSPFDPETKSTYVADQTSVLPFTDISQCITPLGNNLLIGGRSNIIYPWDTFSNLPQYPILVAESNIQKLITINTNVYALVGNRGRIYVTNGSQAQLYKKIPDHISGTVEPYFTWGGITSTKNQLYFGFSVLPNGSNTPNNNYGGVWAIDIDTKALRLTNKISYNTYAGIASLIIPNFTNNPSGTGLFIGWCDGSGGTSITGNFGIDTTQSQPYTVSQATIDFELVNVGTFYKSKVYKTVEYKLSVPMVTGESVSILAREKFSDAFVLIGTTNGANNNGSISDNYSVNFDNSQWVQLRAVLNSTASSPSYCRLKEIRIK